MAHCVYFYRFLSDLTYYFPTSDLEIPIPCALGSDFDGYSSQFFILCRHSNSLPIH